MASELKYATQADITAYREDGVVCLRGIFDQEWLDLIGAAWERMGSKIRNGSRPYEHIVPLCENDPYLEKEMELANAPETLRKALESGFTSIKWMYLSDKDIQKFVEKSPAAQIVGEVLEVDSVRFFWDQMFVKKANAGAPTYWHTDMPAWPVSGVQIPSFWIPLTPIDKTLNSLEFVKGSHLTYDENEWPRSFNADQLTKPCNRTDFKDIESLRETLDLEITSYDMEPGDALLFDPRLYHGGGANNHPTQERIAISTRWMGPDVTWHPRPESLNVPGWPHHEMLSGGPIEDSKRIPVIWRRD